MITTLRWRHNGCDSVSNHQPHDCLLNRLFRRRSKKTSKLRVTGLCAGITGDRWIPRTNGQLHGKCFHLMTSSWQFHLPCFPFTASGAVSDARSSRWSRSCLFTSVWKNGWTNGWVIFLGLLPWWPLLGSSLCSPYPKDRWVYYIAFYKRLKPSLFLTLWPWPLTHTFEKCVNRGHCHYRRVCQIWK